MMQCTKCKTEMHKSGVLTAGNTKYEKWQCTKCWAEVSKALGVIGGTQDSKNPGAGIR